MAATAWTDKVDAAARSAAYFEWASRFEAFASRQYAVRPEPVGWGDGSSPEELGILVEGDVDRDALAGEIERSRAACAAVLDHFLACSPHPLTEQARTLVTDSRPHLGRSAPAPPLDVDPPATATRVLRGPRRTTIDERLEPSRSLLEEDVPGFGESLAECVPYFWNLSVREAMAADLCSLSIVEYDGLPLDFYRDMAKQAWDESLHASYFLAQAQELIPELVAGLEADAPLRERLGEAPLPIPAEGNLYPAIWSMDLVDRLVLMHHDTETPAIPRLRQQMHGAFCRRHPPVAAALEIVRLDEISHSKIGARWLRALVPEHGERVRAIERARALRGFYLVAALATGAGTSPDRIVAAIAPSTSQAI